MCGVAGGVGGGCVEDEWDVAARGRERGWDGEREGGLRGRGGREAVQRHAGVHERAPEERFGVEGPARAGHLWCWDRVWGKKGRE